MCWNPEEDGVTHINIFTRGKTKLGRFLTNLSLSPFHHPQYGRFASVEGLWYWLSTGMKHDELRDFLGFEAKSYGKKLERVEMDPEEFQAAIKKGITAKLLANPQMLNAMINTDLPFAHYYVYYGKVVEAGHDWLVEYHEYIRQKCRERGWRAS